MPWTLKDIDKPRLRWVSAILLTPPLTAFIAILMTVLLNPYELPSIEDFLIMVIIASGWCTYPAMVFLGIPILIAFKVFNVHRFLHYVASGSVVGVIYMLPFYFLISSKSLSEIMAIPSMQPEITFVFLISLIGGAVCGSLNWAFLFMPIKKAAHKPPSNLSS